MIPVTLSNGMFQSNCHIVGDNGHGIIVDAGVDTDDVFRLTDRLGITIDYIVLTHGHIDHMCHMTELRKRFNCPILIHQDDAAALTDPLLNGSLLFGLNERFDPADILVKHGDVFNTETMAFEILHTPGHSPGGICIRTNGNLFTGDTLFKSSIGRTDLGFGDHDLLMESIKNRILCLDDEIRIYPGHGPSTTIGDERKRNPFLKELTKNS